MKFSSDDFQLIRMNVAAVIASLVLSGIALYASQIYADHSQSDLRNAQNQMNSARSRLNTARQDQEYFSTYSSDYAALEARNLIGKEYRLDWIEGLDKLRRQNLVLDFRYNIAPQTIYAPQPAINSGSFDINYSEMKLQFDLLHEGQLLNFFSALENQITGQYQLANCILHRTATDELDEAEHNDNHDESYHDIAPSVMVNIKAECTGGWITLKNRNAQP